MSRVFVVHETGGPQVMRLEERTLPSPGAGEIALRHTAIGLNFADTYHRTGLYTLDLPFTPGIEGAGIVTAVGEGVTDLKVGDRIGYVGPPGGYADERLLPAARAVRLPDGISDELAAAVMSKAGTAHYLLFETWPLKASDTILVHAAAGGVGSVLVQWATAMGATVIATAGTDDKLASARADGAKHAFNSRGDWVKQVRDASGGHGVDVVFDGVGKVTFEPSLDCLRPRGLMVSYGNASGPVTGISLSMLQSRGSLYVTRPTSAHYYGTPEDLRRTMAAVFEAVAAGKIRPRINQRLPLAEAQAAHRALEARETTGMTVLIP